jgi:hypothetical protein
MRERGLLIGSRQGKREHLIDVLTITTERLAASRQDSQRGTFFQEIRGERCRGVDHVLAIVEQQQAPAGTEALGQHTKNRCRRRFENCNSGRHRLQYEAGIMHGSEIDVPGTSGKVGGQLGRYALRKPRLSDATDTNQRHQSLCAQELLELADLTFSPDEAAQRGMCHGRRASLSRPPCKYCMSGSTHAWAAELGGTVPEMPRTGARADARPNVSHARYPPQRVDAWRPGALLLALTWLIPLLISSVIAGAAISALWSSGASTASDAPVVAKHVPHPSEAIDNLESEPGLLTP